MIRKLKNIVIEILYFFLISFNKFPKIKSVDETIHEIIEGKKSICRFGDGEIGLLKNEGVGFQVYNNEIKNALNRIIEDNKNNNILIGLPNIFCYKDLENTVDTTKRFWKTNLILNYKEYKKFNSEQFYYNSFITRPYIRYKNKNQAEKTFTNLKKIWENREIVFVEGCETKLGIGNDLFDNAKKIERIICPNKNAFSKYNEILESVKKIDNKKLIIIALGPTATVLAYDLSKLGYQALDLGHIDIEYEWFKKGVTEKVYIDGKYNNEVNSISNINEIYSENYDKQIINQIL